MSVEIEKKFIKTFGTIAPQNCSTLIESDIIVPDYQPDVKKVLISQVLPMVCEKRIQKDFITLSGNMDYSIIYLSDEKSDDGRIKSIKVRNPFTHQLEVKNADSADFSKISAQVSSVEFSVVNSRKINIKSVIDFESDIIVSGEVEALGEVLDQGVPFKTREVNSFSLCSYAENEFEVSNCLPIPSGSDMIDEILKVDVKVAGREIKSINSKLVAKGVVELCALYTDTSGQINTLNGEIPFTEVLSVEDNGSDLCEVEYSITDFQFSPAADSDGDISTIDLYVKINASSSVFEQSCHTICDDLYSPGYSVSISKENADFKQIICSNTDRLSFKESIDISREAPPIEKIFNVIAKPYVQDAKADGGKAVVSGVTDVYLQYISSSAEHPVFSVKKEVPFSYSVSTDKKDGGDVSVVPSVDNISFSYLNPASAEVKFSIDFETKVLASQNVEYIKNAEFNEKSNDELKSMPGLVIYFASKGESMWDIAKRYNTTREDIFASNGKEFPEILSENEKIMIPRKK